MNLTELQQLIYDLAYRPRSAGDIARTIIETDGDRFTLTEAKAEVLNMVSLGVLQLNDIWEVQRV